MVRERILLVEDDPLVAAAITLQLQEVGYAVVGTCDSGVKALELMADLQPDLVLMDIMLKGSMDGIETAIHLRREHDIPVVYLTAYADDVLIDKAKVSDSFGYIVKPSTARELHAVITLALYRAKTTRELQVAAWASATLISICDAVITLDPQRCVSTLNPAAERMLHVREVEVLGKPVDAVLTLLDRIDGLSMSAIISAVVDTGEAFRCENSARLGLVDSTEVPVHFSVSPILTPRGMLLGITLVLHNDTERVAAEAAQHISELQFKEVVDNTAAVIHIKDLDGRYLLVNTQYEKIVGMRREQMLGKTDYDWFPKEIADSMRRADARVLTADEVGVFDERVVQEDGQRDYISVKVPLHDAQGKITAVCGISTDITEQRRREHGLARLSNRLRELGTLLDNEPAFNHAICQGIVELVAADLGALPLLDEDGEHFSYRDAVGARAGLVRGKTMAVQGGGLCGWVSAHGQSLNVPDLSADARVIPELARALDAGSALVVPLLRNGRVVGGLTAFRKDKPFDALDQELLTLFSERVGVAMENMALLKALEQRVEERSAQLADSNAELEAFSYSLSHDLRGPLHAIDASSQALLENYSAVLDTQGRDYLQRVHNGAARMNELIDNLLALSRVSHSAMRRKPVDLSALAAAVVQALQARTPERQVAVDIAPGLLTDGDAQLLQDALENLLGNAWTFTRQQAQARIAFGAEVQQGQTVYFVRDNGVGFDLARAGKLFGAFERLQSEDDPEGTGSIGLATAHRVIQRHGGKVWAESEPGQGATFYFTL